MNPALLCFFVRTFHARAGIDTIHWNVPHIADWLPSGFRDQFISEPPISVVSLQYFGRLAGMCSLRNRMGITIGDLIDAVSHKHGLMRAARVTIIISTCQDAPMSTYEVR